MDSNFVPTCSSCKVENYDRWKLIGVTIDDGCEVIKCILPYLICEKCFRKRFCYQKQTPYLCGIAVFPPIEGSPSVPKPAPVPLSRAPVVPIRFRVTASSP